MKIEKSRRVVESRPMCLDLNGYMLCYTVLNVSEAQQGLAQGQGTVVFYKNCQ